MWGYEFKWGNVAFIQLYLGRKAIKLTRLRIFLSTVRPNRQKNSVLYTAGLLNSTVTDITFKMLFEILSPWQRISGGQNVTTYSRAKSSHIQNNINYVIPIPSSFSPSAVLSYSSSLRAVDVMALPWDPNLNYIMLNNCAYVWTISEIYERRMSWRDLWYNRGTYLERMRKLWRSITLIRNPTKIRTAHPVNRSRKRDRSSQLCSCLHPFTTGMRRITTFRSTTDGGPIRL